ncbi:hypothetical protein [Ligilactobacillus salivarius]|uniref:hypothetical protein n=1 Tax=Ligilactobacillus salivarius TaxID=1624 RepID=UPI0009D95CB4|nr:hypothetical protein [Ligilactobacillus salivarius]OQR18438.1 hypothetical protein B6U39_10880 [Ligilactobacillus salivarius]
MIINANKHTIEEMYKVGNVIQWKHGNIYLIVKNDKYGYSIVNLTNNKVYATYDTMKKLIHAVASKDDVLLNAEIKVF